jgi:predicted PhzF superfamily epimerase YddE/YHI9
VFHTRSGELRASCTDAGIELEFPATPAAPVDASDEAMPRLTRALGRAPTTVARSDFYVLAEMADAGTVRDLTPDLSALRDIDTSAVIATARSDDDRYDIVSRVFGPRVGIPEDPVTGSAHCVLAPWWCPQLGRSTLRAYQASARGGSMQVTLTGDRVLITGAATTVLRGDLLA